MKPKLLVIEDDPTWSELVREILTKNDYEVTLADTPEAAIAAVKAQVPALIVLDLKLNGKVTGFDLCQKFSSDPRTETCPILMLTGFRDTTDKVRGLETGADDYLVKPFHASELLARVMALLRRPPVSKKKRA